MTNDLPYLRTALVNGSVFVDVNDVALWLHAVAENRRNEREERVLRNAAVSLTVLTETV